MRKLLLLVVMSVGCSSADAFPIPVTHQQILQVAALVSPYSIVANIAGPYTYCLEYPIPAGVTSVEVGVHNRDLKTSTNGTAYTMTGLAVGTGNASGSGWGVTPNRTTWSNVSVPGDGSIVWSGPASITRSAQGTILVAWQLPTGANVAYEWGDGAALPSGYVNAAGTPVNTLASMVVVDGTTTLLGGGVVIRYKVSGPELTVASDSINRGIQYAGLANTAATLVGSRGYSVAVNGTASTTALQWADTGWWTWSHYNWRGNVFVSFGTNDIYAGDSAATIETHLTTIVAIARLFGARRVGLSTIPPSSVFTGAMNTQRNATNTAILGGCCGADWTVDADSLTRSAPDVLDAACGAGPVHLNATCLQLIVGAIPSL